MNNNPTLYAGVDGGGTKCCAILFNHKGEEIAKGIAGAANAARDLPCTLNSIVSSIELALQQANLTSVKLSQIKVGAGLAGACVPDVKAKLLAWQHPFADFCVDSDLAAACYGAHAGNDGALLIVGTGSSAARLQKGQLTQFGGHGFLLGDKGSGSWFGRSAVSSTLEAGDRIIPTGELHKLVMSTLDVKNNVELLQCMINASASEFAALAPLVVELAKQDEPTALALVADGVTYLDTLCQQTLSNTDLSLVLMGGLAPSLEPWFSSVIRERIVTTRGGPEWGAVRLLKSDFPLVSENMCVECMS